MKTDPEFPKYRQRGAYHWLFISLNPFRHHCPTTARYKAIVSSLPSWHGARVVDVGCGEGALMSLLLRKGASLTGVDPNKTALELAQREFERRGFKADLHLSLDRLPSNHFDVAVCADVIEHVADPDNLLRSVMRVLKPGGKVVISTPVRLTEIPIDPNHLREYFPSEFRELMQKWFQDVNLELHIPMPGLMLYYWRPWFLLKRPIITYIINLIDIVFGINCVAGISALNRYHTIQVAVGTKLQTFTLD